MASAVSTPKTMGRAMARGLIGPEEVADCAAAVAVVEERVVLAAAAFVVVLLRTMRTCGPGKRIMPVPMRMKLPLVGFWARGAARERVAVERLAPPGR